MKFYFLFLFLFFLFPCFAYKVKHPIKKVNSATQNSSSKKATPSKSSPQAKGVILKFFNWPDSYEGKLIVKYLGQFGLVKKAKLENFKSWIFEWSELGKAVEAQRLCGELLKVSNIPSLEYCEPDYSTTTAKKQETVNHEGAEYILLRSWVNNRNLSIVSVINFLERKKIPILYVDNPEVPALKAAGKSYSPTVHAIPNTASNQSLLAEFAQGKKGIQTPELQPVQKVVIKPSSVPSSQQNINQNTSKSLRSCSILSSEADLFEGKLSDYWAQEMVGSDLLKEELKKAEPIKKHLVEVFDIPPRHDVGVRNLISDEGQHSVLPEIGDKAGITHTPTNSKALIAADNLLTKVNNACAASSSSSQQEGGSDSNQQSSSKQKASNQIGGGSDQQSSSKKKTANQGGGGSSIVSKDSENQEQETVSVGEGDSQTEYIMLRAWSNNHHIEISSIISGLKRKGIAMQYVDNPHITDLQEAGESYSPQIYVIPNTESNREKLEQVLQRRGRIVYNRNMTVIWKAATDWGTHWKSSTEVDAPGARYDLEATYEVDRSKSLSLIARREYRYIFRPPVLDLGSATSASTENFNWLPPVVLLNKNGVRKLKVWGTREVGKGPLTINGVSVSLTMVPSTISDVAGSSKTHGRWETVLTEDQFNTIYNSGISTDSNTPVRKVSSQNVGQTQAVKKASSQKVQVNKQPPQSGREVSSNVKKQPSIVFPTREWQTSRGRNIRVSHSEDYVSAAQLSKYLSEIGYFLPTELIYNSSGPWKNELLKYEDAVNAIPALTARSDQLKKDRAKASAIRRKLQKNPYFYLDMQKAKGGNLPAWVEQWKNDNPEKYDNYKKGNH